MSWVSNQRFENWRTSVDIRADLSYLKDALAGLLGALGDPLLKIAYLKFLRRLSNRLDSSHSGSGKHFATKSSDSMVLTCHLQPLWPRQHRWPMSIFA